MEYRESEIKAGLFIFISLLLLLAFLFVISGAGSWGQKATYRVRFPSVSGVEQGSLVRFAGLQVGRVKNMAIPADDDFCVELLLEVEQNTPIRNNSQAKLTTIGIMGAYYVEISQGTPDSPRLAPGSLIPTKTVSTIAQLSEPGGEALSEFKEMVIRLNLLLSQENRDNFASLLQNLNDITAANAEQTSRVMGNLDRATAQLDETLQLINQILARNDTTLHTSLTHMDQMLVKTVAAVEQINRLTLTVDTTIGQNQEELQRLTENLGQLAENLNHFSQQIKQEPWSLVRKNYAPERKLPE